MNIKLIRNERQIDVKKITANTS